VIALRVLIAGDVRFYSDGLALLLARGGRFDVLAVVRQAADLPGEVARHEPDVVLVDLALPGSVAAVRTLRVEAPAVSVIALAVPEREAEILEFAEAGVAGFVTRGSTLEQLMATIESVARGELPVSPRVAATLLQRIAVLAARSPEAAPAAALTGREREIVALIDAGMSNKEIAQRLSIEVATVKNHVHHILGKLQVNRRAEAAATLRNGTPFEI
jgi:two-component system nitrate/nitrite response regulator NarL